MQSDTRNILHEISNMLLQSEYVVERIDIPWKLIFTLRQHAWAQHAMIEDILTEKTFLFGLPEKIVWEQDAEIAIVQSSTRKD
jgi:hypothetical protein